jgi:hypothetical protein
MVIRHICLGKEVPSLWTLAACCQYVSLIAALRVPLRHPERRRRISPFASRPFICARFLDKCSDRREWFGMMKGRLCMTV